MVKLANLKGLASLGGADSIGTGIAGIFWFFLATLIEPEEFGEIQYYLSIAGVALFISMIGAQNTITVYVAKNIKLLSTLYVLTIILSIASAIILFLIFYRLDVSVIIFGYVIGELCIAYLLGKKFFTKYAWYVITQKSLTLILGLIFFYLFGVEGVIFGLALSYIHYVKIFFNGLKNSSLNFKLFRSRIEFIGNNYMHSLVHGVRGRIGHILIAPLLGFALLGEFSLALQILAVLMMFSGIAFKYLLPQDATGAKNYKLKKIVIVLAVIITILGITVLPLILPTVFPKYVGVVDAIQIISLGIIPVTLNMIFISQLLGNEKSRSVLIGESITFTTIIFGIVFLGPIMEIKGLAISYVLAYSFQTIYLIFVKYFQKTKNTLNR